MAKVEERTTEQVRREIDLEREQLATAVDSLRGELARRAAAARVGGGARSGIRAGGRDRSNGEAAVPPRSRALTFRGSIAILKQAGQQFIADDCMGLAQQVAYSSLLAFFPAVAFLLGLLGTVHLYDDVESLLGAVAPRRRDPFHRRAPGGLERRARRPLRSSSASSSRSGPRAAPPAR